jgi:hypothetical protein
VYVTYLRGIDPAVNCQPPDGVEQGCAEHGVRAGRGGRGRCLRRLRPTSLGRCHSLPPFR